MGSQMLDIIRQGIWASLTGGWYYNPHHDPHHRLFTNTLHLYAWLFLLCLPFSIHLYFPIGSWAVWLVYSIIIGVFFIIIKSINSALHHLFETGHLHEETVGKVNQATSKFGSGSNKEQEEIELQDIRTEAVPSTPPVGCSSRNSVTEGRDNDHASASARRARIRDRAASTFDLKVDVHTSKPVDDATRTASELDPSSQSTGTGQPSNSNDAGPGLFNQLHAVAPQPNWIHNNNHQQDYAHLKQQQQQRSAGATGPQRSPPPHFKFVVPQATGAAGVKFLLSGSEGEAIAREKEDVVVLVEESPGHTCIGEKLVGKGQPKYGRATTSLSRSDEASCSKSREEQSRDDEDYTKLRQNLGLSESSPNDMSAGDEVTQCDRTEEEPAPGEEMSPSHRSQNQTPGHRSQGEVSMSSDSHSISMSGEQDKSLRMDGARRFSNLSNLARSLPSGSSSALQPGNGTGSLDLAAILDTSLTGVRRRGQGGRQERHVRRTRSALETGGTNRLVGGVASHPVSLDAGINSEVRGRTRTGPRGRSLDLTNSQVIAEIAEGSDEVGGSWEESEEPFQRTGGQLSRRDSVDGCRGNSDVDMVTYQNQLAEATNALLVAGKYLEECDSKNLVMKRDENGGSGIYLQMVGSTSDWNKTDENNGSGVTSDWNEDISPTQGIVKTPPILRREFEEKEGESKENGELSSEASGSSQVEKPKLERETHSLLSTVGLDWLFGDSEPDQPPGSPKLVPGGDLNYVRNRGSRSQSPKLATQDSSESREPRDSSHGSSGTDTETRTLLKALSASDYSNIKISKMTGGAIPKRRPSYPRPGVISELPKPPEARVECGPSWDTESSWENEWRRKNAIRRRPTLDSSNEAPVEDLDTSHLEASPSLHDDAAGLMLFLDILNMPDGERNLEAENELKRLVECRRKRMDEDCQRVKKKRDRDRNVTTRRRRRHNAEHQSSNEGEHQDFPFPTGQMVLDERKQEDEGAKRKRRKSRRRGKTEKETALVPGIMPGLDDTRCTHVAATHEDTSSGAVHCFQDERGNWQTYQFGDDSQISRQVGGLPSAVTPGRALAGLLGRQISTENGGSGGSTRPGRPPPPDPPNSTHCERWSRSQSSSSLSADSGLTVILDSPATVFQPPTQGDRRSGDSQSGQRELRLHPFGGGATAGTQPPLQLRRYHNPLHMFAESFFERTRAAASAASIGNNAELTFSTSSGGCVQLAELENSSLAGQLNLDTGAPRIRKYHLLPIPFTKGLKITMDRLQLEALLDQDRTIIHSVLCILLAVLSSVLGSLVMETGLYRDIWVLLFCLVQASCQYTLMKSVQPDASSPTHGFNKITVFSRPIYFSICCSLLLFLEHRLHSDVTGFELYGRIWFDIAQLTIARDFFYTLLLCFPIIFSMGLFPQANTALIYTFEQIDIQIFGGNAASSLQSSIYCVMRSLFSVAGLFGFAYGGLTVGTHSAHAQEVLFSIFCALTVAISYHLSRGSGDPTVAMSILKRHLLQLVTEESPVASAASLTPPTLPSPSPSTTSDEVGPPTDPLPKKLRDTVNARLKNDGIVMILTAVIVFLVHQSDAFAKGHPKLDIVLWSIAGILGFLLHYLLPHLRKQTPWQCFSAPILTSNEHTQFEVRAAAKVMWWEKILLWMCMLERSVLYPLIFLSAVTMDRAVFKDLFGLWGGSIIMTVTMLKCLRIAFSDCAKQYLVLTLSLLLFQYQPDGSYLNNIQDKRQSPFLLDYFLTSILMLKLEELYLKCQFVITYIAPHQINWGSAFHAFAQPFSVPHSAMLFLQAVVSSVLSTPLNPILGSTIFITSYVRPIKFWERNYNTKRTDHSNTRLSAQFENRNPGADDNNLNSIFYEHLTRSLQHSLCGDLMLGRWGPVQQGDCFVLASDYLNCLVHIIELGNGLCTFQVRGLEFRGTYCQQREVEAISEGVEEDEGCCCCEPGHLPHMLSINAAFSQRWLAWEVAATKYVLEGYSISDNSAQSMLQVFDLRKVLINYYVKSIIYYTVRSPKLGEWMANPTIQEAIKVTMDKGFVDLDPMFNANIDEDFDYRSSGITRPSFCNIYLNWIQHCVNHRDKDIPATKDSEVVSLCLALSLLGRRALGAASNNSLTSVEFFLIGLHALFKGDFRITSVRDEWVFSDMELLRKVVAPGVRMCLKLHQDHFMSPDEYEEPSVLYDAICGHERDLIISHEGDPAWRAAVLSGAPSLLALRHVVDDGTDEYKIIMLNKRHLSFRVIKLNRECVRGLWAGQQQELIFLRNRNPERGSIQNAKQALRNIINSSCDQPIGYPIYVSPLTTSYSETSEPVSGVVGGPVSFLAVKELLLTCCDRIRQRCVEGCSSGSSAPIEADTQQQTDPEVRGGSLTGNRASTVSTASKPSSGTLVSLAGLLGSQSLVDKPGAGALPMAKIVDPLLVYDNMNLGRRIDPLWPMADWQAKGGRSAWKDWIPLEGMEGQVVHRWTPSNPLPLHRSHIDRTILLLKLDDKFVPIAESAVQFLPVREASVDSDWKRSPDVTELRASRLAQTGPSNSHSRIGPVILPRVVDYSPPDTSPSMDRRLEFGGRDMEYDRDDDMEMAGRDATGQSEQNLCMEILRHMENDNVIKDSEKEKCANEDTTSRDVYIDIGEEEEPSDNHIQNNI